MDFSLAVVPVGKLDPAEVEAAAARLAKILNKPVALRAPAAVPRAGDDPARGQHLAAPFLADLRGQIPRLKVEKLVAHGVASGPPTAAATYDATLFVTDLDLYRPGTDGVFGEVDPASRTAVVSLRRLREAFYKRKADPARQRARLVKLALTLIGRARGLPECRDPGCALAATASLADVDTKPEKYCAACWRRLTTGAFRI